MIEQYLKRLYYSTDFAMDPWSMLSYLVIRPSCRAEQQILFNLGQIGLQL